jgi:hypothetical protein
MREHSRNQPRDQPRNQPSNQPFRPLPNFLNRYIFYMTVLSVSILTPGSFAQDGFFLLDDSSILSIISRPWYASAATGKFAFAPMDYRKRLPMSPTTIASFKMQKVIGVI